MKKKQLPAPPADTSLSVELWPTERLIPYAANARKLNDKAVDTVAASLREFGFRQPIVTDSEGVVVVGHTRLLAAKQLGLAEVPVHVAAGLTAGQIKAYRLMDNRSHDNAEWDLDQCEAEFERLKESGIDLSLTGFDQAEIDRFLNTVAAVDFAEFDESIADTFEQPMCKCPECGEEFPL